MSSLRYLNPRPHHSPWPRWLPSPLLRGTSLKHTSSSGRTVTYFPIWTTATPFRISSNKAGNQFFPLTSRAKTGTGTGGIVMAGISGWPVLRRRHADWSRRTGPPAPPCGTGATKGPEPCKPFDPGRGRTTSAWQDEKKWSRSYVGMYTCHKLHTCLKLPNILPGWKVPPCPRPLSTRFNSLKTFDLGTLRPVTASSTTPASTCLPDSQNAPGLPWRAALGADRRCAA